MPNKVLRPWHGWRNTDEDHVMEEQEVRRRRRWRDRSRGEKAALLFAYLAEFSSAAAAGADPRRPQGEVGEPKWRWALLIGVNFAGPFAYFNYGRVHSLGTADR